MRTRRSRARSLYYKLDELCDLYVKVYVELQEQLIELSKAIQQLNSVQQRHGNEYDDDRRIVVANDVPEDASEQHDAEQHYADHEGIQHHEYDMTELGVQHNSEQQRHGIEYDMTELGVQHNSEQQHHGIQHQVQQSKEVQHHEGMQHDVYTILQHNSGQQRLNDLRACCTSVARRLQQSEDVDELDGDDSNMTELGVRHNSDQQRLHDLRSRCTSVARRLQQSEEVQHYEGMQHDAHDMPKLGVARRLQQSEEVQHYDADELDGDDSEQPVATHDPYGGELTN